MNADGSGQVNLTNDSQRHDWDADWSPDGTRIALTSQRDGNHEIYLMDADGSNQVNLTNHPFDDFFPDWPLLRCASEVGVIGFRLYV